MGLFGLIYTSIVTLANMYKNISNDSTNMYRRKIAKENGSNFYVGSDNEIHYVKDGRKIMFTNEYTRGYSTEPDKVLKYVDTGEIIHNYTKDKRIDRESKAYLAAIEKGYSTYRLGGLGEDYGHTDCRGYRFMEIETGRIFVIRTVCSEDFFMDVETTLLVRHTDEYLERLEKYKQQNHITYQLHLNHIKENMFENFNKQQLDYIEKFGRKNYRNKLANMAPYECA